MMQGVISHKTRIFSKPQLLQIAMKQQVDLEQLNEGQ
jgi:hypothetical protein